MCDALTIAGLALTAGATVANTMASNKVAKARSNVMQAESERQKRLDVEAQGLNTQSQDRYKGFGANMDKRGTELADYFSEPMPASDATGVPTELTPTTTSVVTQNETAKQKGEAGKYVGQQAKALGTLRSFGDYLGGVSRLQARDAGTIGQIGGYKKGSAEVTPFELDAAGHAGDNMKLFGDILQTAGGAATAKGLQGDWGAVAGGTSPVTLGGAAASGVPIPKLRSSLGIGDIGLLKLYGGPR